MKTKAKAESKSISWRMKMPRELHRTVSTIAKLERREINAQYIKLVEEALEARRRLERALATV